MIIRLLILFVCHFYVASALLCYTCSNEPSFDACFKRGRLTQCRTNENACHTEVLRFLRPQGVIYSISKRCKQSDACENNQIQNPRAAWKPSQCNLKFPSSVCRCCCLKDKCNFGGLYCVVGPACGRIPVIDQDGITRCTLGRNEDSVCTNICDPEHKLMGPEVFSCQKTDGKLQWNMTEPSGCIKTTCNADVLNIKNGFASCTNGNNMGSICEFSCKEGHVLQNGWPVTSCNSPDNRTSVRWDSDVPTCERFTCLELDAPDNGRLKCTDANRIGSKCSVKCDLGYYKSKKRSGICQLNNNQLPPVWGEELPVCLEVECPELAHPLNGLMECSNSNLYGSACKFTCHGGFQLLGKPSVTCGIDGKKSARDGSGVWDDDAPRCRESNCLPPLLAPYQGSIDCSAGTSYGSICSFSCHEGYELVGDPLVTCIDAGETLIAWDRPVPICKQRRCPFKQTNPNNGFVACTDDDAFFSVCDFNCQNGFFLLGSETSTCADHDADGEPDWNNKAPLCEKITCRILPPLPNGNTTCTNFATHGSECSFTCDAGYKLVGETLTVCGDRDDDGNGEWSNLMPMCEILLCPNLMELPNGFVSCENENRYDSMCTYTCQAGYRLEGSKTTTCDGLKWTAPPPKCEVITCELITSPEHGNFACIGTKYGESCNYKCDDKYYLIGSQTTTCGDKNGDGEGDWSNPTPTCKPISCSALTPPVNGQKSCTNDDMLNSACTFTCSAGYKVSGPATTICEKTGNFGKWSNPVPTCVHVTCSIFPALANGRRSCTNFARHGSKCTFTCAEGYRLVGDATTTCGDRNADGKGEWTKPMPACRIKTCPKLLPLSNGAVSCKNGNQYGSSCSFSCRLGFRLVGAESISCDGVKWSEDPPKCQRIACKQVTDPANGKTVCVGFKFGDSCKFSCSEKYYVSGSSATLCGDKNSDGVGDWSNEIPTCKPITCSALSTIDNGDIKCSDGVMYKSVCTVTCKSGYKLLGSRRTTCDKTGNIGSWSNPLPKCEEKRCNDIGPPELGEMTCTNDFLVDSVCNFTCAARHVIHPKSSQSLTCMPDEKWNRPLPCCFEQCPPNAVMDMIIAIDSSSSITRKNFEIVIEFVKSLIKSFEVNERMTQFGIFRYNRFVDTQNEIKLNGYKDMDELLDKIDKIPYNGEGTWTGKALQHILDFSLHPSNGNRRDAPDAILLITDGVTNPGDDMTTPAKGIHDNDIRFLAVFVPPFDKAKEQLGIKQLASIAGSRENVVLVKNGFESLQGITASVEEFACENVCHRDDIAHEISTEVEFDISK